MANVKNQNGKQAEPQEAKPEVMIRGKLWKLRMDLWASEQIENEFGDLQETLKQFNEKRSIGMVKQIFNIMARSALKYDRKPMEVPEDLLDGCTLMDLSEISRSMRAAMDKSLHVETIGGNEADDDEADALAAEYEEKNG